MSYHELTKESEGDAASRRAEANRLLEMLATVLDSELTLSQQSFIRDMYDNPLQPISVKQLFWLRDLKDKVIG